MANFDSSPEAVLMPMNPEPFELELRSHATAQLFVRGLIAAKPSLMPNLAEISHIAVSARSMAEPAECERYRKFFSIGNILGLRVMELERGHEFANQLIREETYLPVPDPSNIEDVSQVLDIINQAFVQACDHGVELADPYRDIIEEIGDSIVHTYDDLPYVRRGFGLTMFLARQTILDEREAALKADLLQIEQSLGADEAFSLDWAALSKSFQNGEQA